MSISIVNYMHELKAAGFTDQQSEVQARQLERIVIEIQNEAATKRDLSELSTKKDLELAIERLRYETLRFVVWTGVGCSVTIVASITGMLAKGFHWF